MPFQIIRNDITKVAADAIVNSANPNPIYAGAVDRSIYLAAGAEELLAARQKIGPIAVGSAAYTPAFNLLAKYIIHTVGPVWVDGEHGEFDSVRSCYTESLKLAYDLGCQSIAFPMISSGAYRFPKDLALQAATSAIYAFLLHHEMDVYLVVYDQDAFDYSGKLFQDIRAFIDEDYIDAQKKAAILAAAEGDLTVSTSLIMDGVSEGLVDQSTLDKINHHKEELQSEFNFSEFSPTRRQKEKNGPTLEDILQQDESSFGDYLCELIAEKGMKNSEAYNAANVSKQAFSQIKYSKNPPLRSTVDAFAVALHLTEAEAESLFERAGYSLSSTQKYDRAIRFFLRNHKYNIVENNIVLYQNGLPQLGTNR